MSSKLTLDEAIELGHAWPDWQWAIGQISIELFPEFDSVSTTIVTGVHDNIPCDASWIGGQPAHDRGSVIIPDFRDPGTRGHALAQVRAAWGDPLMLPVVQQRGRSFVWFLSSTKNLVETSNGELISGATEIELLLAARRAAPPVRL